MNTFREWLVFDLRTVISIVCAVLFSILFWTPWDKAARQLWRTWNGK